MKKQALICHSFPSWDAPYTKSTVELMMNMEDRFDLYFIDYAYSWKDVIKSNYIPKSNVLGAKSRVREVINAKGNRIKIFSLPPIIPLSLGKNQILKKIITKINRTCLKSSLRRFVKKEDIQDSIVVNALNPYYGTLLKGVFNETMKVYYCFDNIHAMKWAGDLYGKSEEGYATDSDLVIVTSTGLKNKLLKFNPNVNVVHNGMNDSIFVSQENESNQAASSDSKRIVYLGAIDDRIDYDLLQHLLEAFPNHIFDFVGPVKSDRVIALGEKYKNLALVGSVPQSEAAKFIDESAICIIPFKRDDFTKYIYPLKINEYLALGKPVVSTKFADMSTFEGMISLTDNSEEFVVKLQTELRDDNQEKSQVRVEFALKNTWGNRSTELSEFISQTLERISI